LWRADRGGMVFIDSTRGPLPEDLVAEGHAIPIAQVQAMHEGKRRARAQRGSSNAAG